MELVSSSPDAASFVSALKACASLSAKEEAKLVEGKLVKAEVLKKGITIHSQAEKDGWDLDTSVAISLVDMYAKCGDMVEARKVFNRLPPTSVVPLTALTLGYVESGDGEAALELFKETNYDGAACSYFDPPTIIAALKACTSLALKEVGELVDGKRVKLKALEKGMSFHALAMKKQFQTDTYLSTTLVDMYASCGSMVDSRRVFDRMAAKNAVTASTWNALLLGYSDNGDEDLTLELFPRMLELEVAPNSRTFTAVLKACGAAAARDKLRFLEARIHRADLEVDTTLATSLVDAHGRCGNMLEARRVFDGVPASSSDMVLWTALISGYSRAGDSSSVFEVFASMRRENLGANGVTLLCLLSACSHAGLVDRGRSFFADMLPKFGISPGMEHLCCMVDLLSRANHVGEAVEMAERLPVDRGSAVAWTTILGACSKWNNVEVGKLAFDRLMRVDSQSAGAYDLMANIYSNSKDG